VSRVIRNWQEERVEDFDVAPHRYTWDYDGPEDDLAEMGTSVLAWKAALPYKPGDVIFVDNGTGKAMRAKVLYVVITYDRYDERRPAYQCAVETTKGIFSRLWSRYYPRQVQRGYHLAGLAPDLDGKDI
jgi:hypothetical protein